MSTDLYRNPEPVPAASQLAVLPFLAAVDGYLRGSGNVRNLRSTLHRTMNRDGNGYLQQLCGYLPASGSDWQSKVGRIFPVDKGIMGAAHQSRLIWRTQQFPDQASVKAALAKEEGGAPAVGLSWLAVPFLGPENRVVLILYAECDELNFFADDGRVRHVAEMAGGFCGLFDFLQHEPFLNIRNFSLQPGSDITGEGGVYGVQESVAAIPCPRFQTINSFNYEASVA